MAKKAIIKKTAAKKTAVKKPVSKKASVKKSEVKKNAVKAAAKKNTVKKTTARKPEIKKTIAKKPAVNKKEEKTKAVKKAASIKKPAAKKPSIKKPAVKKTTAKKSTVVKKSAAVKKPVVVKKPTAVKKSAAVKKAAAVKKPVVNKVKTVKAKEWMSVDEYFDSLKLKSASSGSGEAKKTTSKKTGIMLTNEELANFYWQQEKYEELLTLCKNMVEKKETKDSPVWLEKFSDVLCHLGDWQKAIEINKKRTALFPEQWSAWNTLASILAVLGDYKSAVGALNEAAGKVNWNISYDEPDMDKDPPMKEEFFAYSKEGDPSTFCGIFWPRNAMFTLYPKILEKTPKCTFGWYTLAKFYGDNLHYYNEAAGAIEKAVELKPDWKPGLAYLAQMLSYVQKLSIDDGHYMDTEQRNKEIKKKQEIAAKAEKAYEKWDKEKALARRKQKE